MFRKMWHAVNPMDPCAKCGHWRIEHLLKCLVPFCGCQSFRFK